MGSPVHAERYVRWVTNQRSDSSAPATFDTAVLSSLYGFSASRGKFVCYMKTDSSLQNRYATLHGGAIATIVDTVGTAALVTMSKKSGVSLNITVNYVSPAPGDGVARIEAEVVKLGKAVATIEVSVFDELTGDLAAKGTHVKFIPAKELTRIPADLATFDEEMDVEREKGIEMRRKAVEEARKRIKVRSRL